MSSAPSKPRLFFLIHPPSVKSGSDCVSVKGVEEMRKLGVDAQLYELWPDSLANLLMKRKWKIGHLLYKYLVAPIAVNRLKGRFSAGDVVWMYDVSLYANLKSTAFEKSIKSSGAKYVFHLHDDWLSIPGYREAAIDRLKIVDLAGGITIGVLNSIQHSVPGVAPVLLRGPIDVDRLQPLKPTTIAEAPKVIWTGHPGNLKEIPSAHDVLANVYAKRAFRFIIISGNQKPELDLPIPWEWLPYDAAKEAARLSGACAGLAPLEDRPYARCKDVFKVKTYMACGVPPIASAIGNNLDVIKDGVTGFLVNSREEWEARLLELVSSSARAMEMGVAAREECVRRFSHAAIIPEWLYALEERFGSLRSL